MQSPSVEHAKPAKSEPAGPSRESVFSKWKIVELCSGYGPASIAGKIFADLGCPVTKLEEPEGDSLRRADPGRKLSLFDLLCGNKSSLCIRSSLPGAREPFTRLLSKARALVLDQDGWKRVAAVFGGTPLNELFPHLAICSFTPFGRGGNWAKWQANEEIVQAVSGVMSITGHRPAEPTRIAGGIFTQAAAMLAVTAAVADMMQPNARGRVIDSCMFEAAVAFLSSSLPSYFLRGKAPGGIGNRHTMSAPWNSYRCTDGWLIFCLGNDSTWVRFCKTIGRPEFLTDPRFVSQESRVRHVEALDTEITIWTSTRTMAEVEAAMEADQIPCGSILPFEGVIAHQQFADRRLLQGNVTADYFGYRRPGEGSGVLGTCPLGGATRTALVDHFGVSLSDYERWKADEVIITSQEGTTSAKTA